MTTTHPTSARMRRSDALPVGVYLLAFSLFAMGSAEFLLAGVLPAVATDLDVPLSAAGFLITAFAVGVVVGGPPFAVLSLNWPRRATLVGTQAVFAASIAIGLLGNYQVLLLTRVVAGVAYAGFFAVAAVTAIILVTPDRNARASGVVVSGLSVAMVAGGPAGTLLSHFTQWRGGFWAVVAVTSIAMVGCLCGIPPQNDDQDPAGAPRISREVATLLNPRLWVLYGITILTTAAYMITYNYLAAMLHTITRLSGGWIPAVLAVFGVGAFIGLSIGGRISDRRPHFALLTGTAGILALSVLMTAAVRHPAAVVLVVFMIGISAFVLNPAIYARVFAVAGQAPTLAGATTVSAFQLGISITPILAAIPLTQGASLATVCIVGATLAAAALLLIRNDQRSAWAEPRASKEPQPARPEGRLR